MNIRVVLLGRRPSICRLAIVRLIRTARYPLHDKVVLITGGSRGLGLVLARHVCARGGNVALIARDPDALARAKADLVPAAAKSSQLNAICSMPDKFSRLSGKSSIASAR